MSTHMKSLAGCLLGCLLALPAGASTPPMAPEFSLPDASGAPVRLADLRGQVVLVNFFASWCGPCRQELPILSAMQRRYQKLGFTVLGVNLDAERAAADALLEELPPSFPVVFDADSEVAKRYRVSGMPNTAIIDQDGRLRFLHRGYTPGTEDVYVEQVRALLRESR